MEKPDDSDDEPIPLQRADALAPRRDLDNDSEKEHARSGHRPRRGRVRRRGDDYDDDYDETDEGVIRQLIPTANPRALIAYYCGIFGLIPVIGLVLGPFALLFGFLGWQKATR